MFLLDCSLVSLQLIGKGLRHLQVVIESDFFRLKIRDCLFEACKLNLGDVCRALFGREIHCGLGCRHLNRVELSLQKRDLVAI